MAKDKRKTFKFEELKEKLNPQGTDSKKTIGIINEVRESGITNYYLPSDTMSNLKSEQIDNFSLKFNKFAQFDDNKFHFYRTAQKNKDPKKSKELIDIISKYKFSNVDFSKIKNENINIAESLYGQNNFRIIDNMGIDWRMSVGLGSESVYETSMTLHPIYGFPYIPGQAVKGMLRSWIINEKFDKNEGRAISESEAFCKIFGCPKDLSIEDRDENGKLKTDNKGNILRKKYISILKKDYQGKIIFFDSMPINAPILKVDVMNPHYGPYYNSDDNTPPADYYNPIPIYFLTVEDTSFQFIIAIKEKDNKDVKDFDNKKEDQNILKIANDFLQEALENQGLGAKTAVGYGYFKKD